MHPKVRIVCGTGRCGTVSFTALLNKQKGVHATHEGLMLPWNKDLVTYYQGILRMLFAPEAYQAKMVVNVAFYWKNYLSEVFRDIADVRVLFIKRDRQQVIDSFSRLYNDRNMWSDPNGENFTGKLPEWALADFFPSYDLSKEKAIGKFWDEYYDEAEFWLKQWPDHTMLVDFPDVLNNEKIQRKALKFLGVRGPKIDLNIRKNRGDLKPFVLDIYRKGGMRDEIKEVYMNRNLFGNAGRIAGLKQGIEVQLTDDEWDELMKAPNIDRLMPKGKQCATVC